MLEFSKVWNILPSWFQQLFSLAILIILAPVSIIKYNLFVRLRNNRENAFADIDVQLQRRHDLISQLVATVKGYASHEKETISRVVSARSGAINAKNINEKIVAENELTSALTGLNIAVEAYPDLKASTNFIDLQKEISYVESKLVEERKGFNSATKELNTAVEMFPGNIFAGILGFKKEMMFDINTSERKSLEQKQWHSEKNTKPCACCGEEILTTAKKCKHCGEWLDGR